MTKERRGVIDRIATLSAAGAGVALLLIFALEMVEIVMRNGFRRSTMFADEMCGYLNVAVVFLGLAYTLARGGFIRVEVLYRLFAGRVKTIADWYSVLASIVFALIILYESGKYALYSFTNDVRSPEVSQTPQVIPQLLIVIGTSILVLQLFAYIVRRCRDLP